MYGIKKLTKTNDMKNLETKTKEIQKTIEKLNNQLDELKELNRKNIKVERLASDAWCNDDTIRRLQNRADKLTEINLIK